MLFKVPNQTKPSPKVYPSNPVCLRIRFFIFQVQDRRTTRRLLTPRLVRSLTHDPCSRITNRFSMLWATCRVICWYVICFILYCKMHQFWVQLIGCYWTGMTVPAWKGVLSYLNKHPAKVLVCSLSTCWVQQMLINDKLSLCTAAQWEWDVFFLGDCRWKEATWLFPGGVEAGRRSGRPGASHFLYSL